MEYLAILASIFLPMTMWIVTKLESVELMEGDFRNERIDQQFTRMVGPGCHHITKLSVTLWAYLRREEGMDSLSEEQERQGVEPSLWFILLGEEKYPAWISSTQN